MKYPLVAVAIAFVSGAPLIVRAADKPHDFAKWEKEIAAYEAADRAAAPAKGGLLFTGASTIRRWSTLAQDFPQQNVINRGVGGSEIIDITHFADRIVFPYAPHVILLRSGGNDIFHGTTPEQAFANYREFVALVHAKLPNTKVVFISQNPSIARLSQWPKEKALNELAEKFARITPHAAYIDVSDIVLGADGKPRAELFVADGLHFSPAGYRLFSERIRGQLPK